jgi:hypothetical protein
VTGFAQRVLVLGSALLAVPLMIMGMRLQRRTRQSLWADLAIDDLGAVDRRFAMAAVVAEAEDCGCDDGGASVTINGTEVTSTLLRSLELTGADGQRTSVAEVVGDEDKGVVVFLRHLA